MLTVTRDSRGFLEIKQATRGGVMSTLSYSYFDTENWLQTTRGAQGAVPFMPVLPGMREWVEKFYLPKLRHGPADLYAPIVPRIAFARPEPVQPQFQFELEAEELMETCAL